MSGTYDLTEGDVAELAAIAHERGWTSTALAAGARQLGIDLGALSARRRTRP